MRTWDEYIRHWKSKGITPQDVFGANSVATIQQASQNKATQSQAPMPVILPPHLYTPNGAQSIDIRRAARVLDGVQNVEFMRFTAPEGSQVHFIAYSIFSDGTLASTQEFVPRVNGKRVFQYHGDPNDNYKMNLGLGPDLSNQNTIQCQLTLQPRDVLTWHLTNTSGVEVAMGVRMIGYIDSSLKRVSGNRGVG